MYKIGFWIWAVSFVGIHTANILAVALFAHGSRILANDVAPAWKETLYVKLLKHHVLYAGIVQGWFSCRILASVFTSFKLPTD
jgi:hypothetical protein